VTGSALGVPDGSGGFVQVDVVALERWEVPQLVDLAVVAGQPLPIGAPYQPAAPAGTLVPLPPDVC